MLYIIDVDIIDFGGFIDVTWRKQMKRVTTQMLFYEVQDF